MAQEEESYDSGMEIDLQQYIADAEAEASRNIIQEIDLSTSGHAWTISDESDEEEEALGYGRGSGVGRR